MVELDPAAGRAGELRELDALPAPLAVGAGTGVGVRSLGWGAERKSVRCTKCGATTTFDPGVSASRCAFCATGRGGWSNGGGNGWRSLNGR